MTIGVSSTATVTCTQLELVLMKTLIVSLWIAGGIAAPIYRPAECEMASVQREFASSILNDAQANKHHRFGLWAGLVDKSLNYSACPQQEDLPAYNEPFDTVARQVQLDAASAVFVSPNGSDTNGTGTIGQPFATLQRALDVVAYLPTPRTIWLRGGDYFADATSPSGGLSLATVRHSHTTVATYPQDVEQAVLWGGAALPVLSWQASGRTARHAGQGPEEAVPILTATLSASAGPAVSALIQSAWVALTVAYRPAPIPQLIVGGRRMVRSRFPDADPETDRRPVGYYTGPLSWAAASDMRQERTSASGEVQVSSPSRPFSEWQAYSMSYGGALDRFEGTGGQSFFQSSVPASVAVTTPAPGWTNKTWASVHGAVAGTMQGDYWGGWQFGLTSQASQADRPSAGSLRAAAVGRLPLASSAAAGAGLPSTAFKFGRGGFQEARGGSSGSELYVENVLEELTAPGEWYIEFSAVEASETRLQGFGPAPASATLHLAPWSTSPADDPRQGAKVIGATLPTVLRVQGGGTGSAGDAALPYGLEQTAEWPEQRALVSGFAVVNVTVGATAASYMQSYEGSVSGGDWSLHRGGAVVMDGVFQALVDLCTFWRVGGNALVISGRAIGTVVRRTEIGFAGDSGIVFVGRSQLDDAASIPDVPVNSTVDGCFIHDIGVYGKQVAAVANILTVSTTVMRTVSFTGPRQGVVFMDGLGGGHTVAQCSMWGHMLETADGGLVYQWDRLPLLAREHGSHTTAHMPAAVKQSILRCDSGCVWPVDWDDGSNGWSMEGVVSVYGGAKNFQGFGKRSVGSMFVWTNYAATNGYCALSDGAEAGISGFDELWENNWCVTGIPQIMQFGACNATDPTSTPITTTRNNSIFTPGGEASARFCCGHCAGSPDTLWTLDQYRAATGNGVGTVISGDMPTPVEIQLRARALLGL